MFHPFKFGHAPRLVLLMLVLGSRPARAAEDPLQLRVATGVQMERLHSVAADSLGHSATQGIVTRMSCDFRVFDLPMGKTDKPALHLLAESQWGRRTLPVGDFMGAGYTGEPVAETNVIEVSAGADLVIPMTMLDAAAGSRLTLGYRGGLLLSNGGRNDFPHVKQFVFGFERTRGFFEHSSIGMAYGTNEAVGRTSGAKRWAAQLHLEGQIGRGLMGPPRPVAAKGAVPPITSPVHVFMDLMVDTDGSVGPDLLVARTGIVLDAGRALKAVLGGE